MSTDNVLGEEILVCLRSFTFWSNLNRKDYQPTYQPPVGILLLNQGSDWVSTVNRLLTQTHEELSLMVFGREMGPIKYISPWKRISFSLVENCSDWQQYWRDIFKPITKRSKRNRVSTFDSHLETAITCDCNLLSKILTKSSKLPSQVAIAS